MKACFPPSGNSISFKNIILGSFGSVKQLCKYPKTPPSVSAVRDEAPSTH